MFVTVSYLNSSIILVDKARSPPLECSYIRGSAWVGSSLANKYYIRKEVTDSDKHSSLELITPIKSFVALTQGYINYSIKTSNVFIKWEDDFLHQIDKIDKWLLHYFFPRIQLS